MSEPVHDSTPETMAHIDRVQELMDLVIMKLTERAEVHDASKLQSPEKEAFDQLGDNLRGLTYGSDEYRAQLRKIKPAIQHHYTKNSHHPEHYEKGVEGMSLLDLVEMLCDWKAATERHEDGNLLNSLAHNQVRFTLTPQLLVILTNTAHELGWIQWPTSAAT